MIYSYARPFNDVWTNGPDPCNMIYTRTLPFRWKYGRFSVSNTIFFIKVLHILTENRSWLIIEFLLIHPDTNTSKWKRKYNCSNWFRSIRIYKSSQMKKKLLLKLLLIPPRSSRYKSFKMKQNFFWSIWIQNWNETEIQLFKLMLIHPDENPPKWNRNTIVQIGSDTNGWLYILVWLRWLGSMSDEGGCDFHLMTWKEYCGKYLDKHETNILINILANKIFCWWFPLIWIQIF